MNNLSEYRCEGCHISGHKLWRVGNSSSVDLLCVRCTEKETKCRLGIGDQIGERVPAVPNGEGGWWHYTAVPQKWVDWWKGLPI